MVNVVDRMASYTAPSLAACVVRTRPFRMHADSSCNLCWCAEKPDDESAFVVTPRFCVSNRQSCEETSICGRYINSTKDCEEAVSELPLVRNTSRAILTLNEPHAPKGCLLDAELGAYFNTAGTAHSDYAGLMSVCSVRRKKGDSSTHPSISHDHDTHINLQTHTCCQLPSKKPWKHAAKTSHC